MSWGEIQGHDSVVEQFRRAMANNRLASTFLFIGPPGVGKRTFAMRLAKAFLCEGAKSDALEPCGRCPACQQVDAGTHPDLEFISKPKDKSEFHPASNCSSAKEICACAKGCATGSR
jgi:DNA polymerase III subunit delta'